MECAKSFATTKSFVKTRSNRGAGRTLNAARPSRGHLVRNTDPRHPTCPAPRDPRRVTTPQPAARHAGRMNEGSTSQRNAREHDAPPGVRPLTLAAVAVVGATIGVAAVLIADAGAGTPAATGTTPTASATAPGNGSTSGGQSPLPLSGPSGLSGPGGTGNGLEITVGGRVTAVSETSITIGGGAGRSVTAKITKATRFAGTVRGIDGVKVGDQVNAVLTGASATSLTATTIEDPATV